MFILRLPLGTCHKAIEDEGSAFSSGVGVTTSYELPAIAGSINTRRDVTQKRVQLSFHLSSMQVESGGFEQLRVLLVDSSEANLRYPAFASDGDEGLRSGYRPIEPQIDGY